MIIIFDSPLIYNNSLIMAVLRVCGSHFVNAKYGYSIITDDLYMLTFYFNESL